MQSSFGKLGKFVGSTVYSFSHQILFCHQGQFECSAARRLSGTVSHLLPCLLNWLSLHDLHLKSLSNSEQIAWKVKNNQPIKKGTIVCAANAWWNVFPFVFSKKLSVYFDSVPHTLSCWKYSKYTAFYDISHFLKPFFFNSNFIFVNWL